MKTKSIFTRSWFLCAIAFVVVLAEAAAWTVASTFDLKNDPAMVAFLSIGLVTAMASVLYEREDVG